MIRLKARDGEVWIWEFRMLDHMLEQPPGRKHLNLRERDQAKLRRSTHKLYGKTLMERAVD